MSPLLLLGLDVGTSSVKAAVVDGSGTEVAHGRTPVTWKAVPTGAEIDPGELVDAALLAARRALAQAPEGQVAAVGVASMAETGVLLDSRGRPAVPAIAWHDSRGAEEAARLRAEIAPANFAAHTGLRVSPLATIAKYGWMRDQWPQARAAVRWLNVAEWIVRRLGGDEVAELSLACRTGWFELHARSWWDAALEFSAAPAGLLPEPRLAGSPAGTMDSGLLPGCDGACLAIGGHDHLCAALGAGAVGEGDTLDSCGTAEAFVRAIAPLSPARVQQAVERGISVGWHVVEGLQAMLASARSGAALERILALLGVSTEHRAELEREALSVSEDAGGLQLEHLGAERMTLAGIGRSPSPALVYRAALEAVGAVDAELLAAMVEVGGPLRRLVVTGGWAEGEAARAVKQRHLGEFVHSTMVYTGARGAALAAARAAQVDINEQALAASVAGEEER